MSEVMTTEAIIEAEWLLEGYWTKPRFVFKTEKGAWSDVDVLAYHPEKRHLVISESKAHGPKNIVFTYTEKAKEKPFIDVAPKYLSFLDHLHDLSKKERIFKNFKGMVDSVTVQLVCNYAIERSIKEDVCKELNGLLKRKMRVRVEKNFQLDSTIDVIARLISKERKFPQGRRYGNPVLDFVREINRYLHPKMSKAGGASRSKAIKSEIIQAFLDALDLPELKT